MKPPYIGADYPYSLDEVRSYPMRTFHPLLIATVLLAACGQSDSLVGPAAKEPSLLRTVAHSTETIPIEGTVTGTTFCTGEDIGWVGTLTTSTNTVFEPGVGIDLPYHTSVQETAVLKGIGLITGATWLVNQQNHFSFDTPNLPAPNFTATDHVTVELISQGGLPNLLLSFDVHLLATGQGTFKTTVDNFSAKCRG
jgi:hypothetical protein